MSRLIVIAVALLLAGPAWAGDQPAGADLAKKIAPLLDGQTMAVAHISLDQLDAATLVKIATQVAGLKPDEAAGLEKPLKEALSTLKKGEPREMFAVTGLRFVPQEPGFLAIPVENNAAKKKLISTLITFLPPHLVYPVKDFVVLCPKQVAQSLAGLESTGTPLHLDKALAAFPQADIRVALILPDALRRSLGELIPELPQELGGGKTAALLQGFQFFAAGVTLAPKLSVAATLQAGDAKTATDIDAVLLKGMDFFKGKMKKDFPDPALVPKVEKFLELLTPKQDKDRLVWKLTEDDLLPFMLTLAAELRKAAAKSQAANNLKQIGIALHGYHDTHGHFPANVYDKKGKALLSWRVQILPYVEGQQLYQQFKLDEPWDSPHNKALIAQMPPVFRSPTSKAGAGKTTCLIPSGKGLFLAGPKPRKIQEISDGTSNTVMALEVDDDSGVTWTKPADLTVDPKNPFEGLGGNPRGDFHALFADGSVRVLNRNIAPADFYAALTIADGEVLPNLP